MRSDDLENARKLNDIENEKCTEVFRPTLVALRMRSSAILRGLIGGDLDVVVALRGDSVGCGSSACLGEDVSPAVETVSASPRMSSGGTAADSDAGRSAASSTGAAAASSGIANAGFVAIIWSSVGSAGSSAGATSCGGAAAA